MKNVLIIGCGDIGVRVARRWKARGVRAVGLVHSRAGADRLARAGVEALRGDLDEPAALPALPTQDALLYYFAPPPRGGESDPRLRGFLAAVAATAMPSRLVYISTTGVYGNTRGAWVTEASPTKPETARARRRLDAEGALGDWSARTAAPVVILRVPGIYGPGRLPLARLKSGAPVLPEEESGYVNRIHADDLAAVCVAAGARGRAGAVYNVSDGRPGTMSEYFTCIADHFGLPRPPVIRRADADGVLSPEMLSYLDESRRVDNTRMLEELGVVLRYPDLEAGLKAIERQESKE